MAVVAMKRALVIGHADRAEQITLALQRGGVIEIEQAELTAALPDGAGSASLAREEETLVDRVDDTRFVLDFLGRYRVPPKRPFASFVTEKFHIGLAEFEAIDRNLNFSHLLAECRRLEIGLADVDRSLAPLDRRTEELSRWTWLDVGLDVLRGMRTTRAIAFRGDPRHLKEFEDAIKASPTAAESTLSDGAMLVIAHSAEVDAIRELARASGLAETPLPQGSGTPLAELEDLEAEREALLVRADGIRREVEGLSRLYPDALAAWQSARNALARVHARQRFDATAHAVFIQGWVRSDAAGSLVEALAPFEEADITLVDPTEDETPPVEIKNPKWMEPFELLTRLYGMPDYREFDPTPFFAPFFTLFFGITVGDVGYGLILVVACWLIMTKVDIAENAKRFMRLVIYGGFASMAVGVVTGGWFGVDIKDLPPVLKSLVLLDPLNGAMVFLILTVALGVVQITWGILIEAADSVRHGEVWAAVRDQLTTLMVIIPGVLAFAGWIASTVSPTLPPVLAVVYPLSLTMLALGAAAVTFLTGDFFPAAVAPWREPASAWTWVDRAIAMAFVAVVAGWLLGIFGAGLVGWQGLVAMIFVALVASRTGRKMVVGALAGLYNLYGMSGYIGDILSYVRLMALGLATVLIGSTVNLMAKMVFAGLPGGPREAGLGSLVGFAAVYLLTAVGGLAILVVGHTFNVVINLLGSFVHPMRLQFVEFFSKFYEGGGKPFRPLTYTTDTLVLERGEH
jgi:V/A-type H+-transporting ATPase subunit I